MSAQAGTHPGSVSDYLGGAANAAAVTPNDTTELDYITRGLLIGTAGALKVTMQNNQVVTMANVPAGFYPWRVRIVWSNGTAASNIVAFW
jgi:hypothetical protein